jgi:hypothetical protein
MPQYLQPSFTERASVMPRSRISCALFVAGIVIVTTSTWLSHFLESPVAAAQQAEKALGEAEAKSFSPLVKSLPFPPDAREIEFQKVFKEINYQSGSSLASLTDFYQRELKKRGWEHDDSALVQEKDRCDMTFKHDGAKIVLELRQRSDYTDVSLDCKGLDFTGADDPAGLLAAGVPQPRSYLYLQKEVKRPETIQDVVYRDDECHFKAPLALQDAFDFYLKALKSAGWQESRRPIITKDRRYTEFQRGALKLSVNIFAHEVGSRIILGYEDDRKDPVVPPLAAVAATTPTAGNTNSKSKGDKKAGDKKAVTPAMPAVDVSKNTGSATVTHGSEKFVLKYVAAYQSKSDGESRTTLLFCERPLPLERMQQMLATKDNVSVLDLYDGAPPNCLRVNVNGFTSFFFTMRSGGIGDSIENSDHDIKLEQGRVRGKLKMSEPKKVFDDPFQLEATIDAAVMTPTTRIGAKTR